MKCQPWISPIFAVIGAFALLGCGDTEIRYQRLPEPSREQFATDVAPILEHRCADGGCHGRSERFFSLYSVGRRRMDPAATFSRVPLTATELEANYRATLGFIDSPDPLKTTLLQKAMATGGPKSHGGGVVFTDGRDPECRAVAVWLGASLDGIR